MEAVMMPSIVNNDELSDETESINLDLHVSDTEESTESLKKSEAEHSDQVESEEDILNKYIDDGNEEIKNDNRINGQLPVKDETYKKCNGTITSHDDVETEEDHMNDTLTNDKNEDTFDETLLNEKDDAQEPVEHNTKEPVEHNTKEPVEHNTKELKTSGESDEGTEEESQDQKPIENHEMTSIDECDHTIKASVTESTVSEKNSIETESQNKGSSEDPDEDEPSCSENVNQNNIDDKKTDNDQEDDDLLCVMDEKSVEEANDNKDENSCSASEKDDETKESEDCSDQNNEENMDDINEDTNEEIREENQEERNEESTDDIREDEETDENTEGQTDVDVDASECAMDIEDSDIGGVVYTDTRIVSSEQLNTSVSKVDADKDANKENEHNSDIMLTDVTDKHVTTVDSNLKNGDIEETAAKNDTTKGLDEEKDKDTQKKCTKRQLSDSSTESESTKKIKLQIQEADKPVERQKRSIKFLDSFKKFMLDKKLKSLTRFELEELCIQKMCECIVNKSEIGELRQKVMIQEQTIDTWRKEAIVVAKQTRDLKIVHERLMADLKIMKEQTGKPLVPVKITRSVGLQAIIEHPSRIRPPPLVNGTPPPQQRSPIMNSSPQQTKNIPSTQNRQLIKSKGPPPRINSANNTRPLQPITQKNNVNNVKSRQTVSSPQQNLKKNAELKGVIDLTDEDEKNQNAKQSTNTGSPTVRILNKQNIGVASKTSPQTPNSQPSKIMFVTPNVLQRNSAVMVKMNSNGLVSPQNGLTTIPNGQVSMVTSPVVRTVSPLKSSVTTTTTVRTTTPVKQIYKHPAPLPAAPNYPVLGRKPLPPKPHLNLTRSVCGTGIVLQWKMPYKLEAYETIVSYQLYAYQETKSPPKTDNWGKIGDVKALELPMAVTLTQFAVGNRYFFAVRAVDLQKRLGPFSEPENILL